MIHQLWTNAASNTSITVVRKHHIIVAFCIYIIVLYLFFISHRSHTCFTVLYISYCLGNAVWRETLMQQKLASLANDQKFAKVLLHLISSRDELNGMLILNYFKHVPVEPTTDKRLPERSGSLSKSVPTNAIELANAELLKLDTTCGSRTGPYLMLTPAHRYEIGKRAAKHGVTASRTASIHYFAKKYPKLPLKEMSIRRFKNLYVAECKQKESFNDYEEVEELPRKKEGRPLFLPHESDSVSGTGVYQRTLPVNVVFPLIQLLCLHLHKASL